MDMGIKKRKKRNLEMEAQRYKQKYIRNSSAINVELMRDLFYQNIIDPNTDDF
jgi:hypothetical protein